jgi:hypothetical protein
MQDKQPDKFSEKETQRRMEAALRGARVAGPQHREASKKPQKVARKKAASPAQRQAKPRSSRSSND